MKQSYSVLPDDPMKDAVAQCIDCFCTGPTLEQIFDQVLSFVLVLRDGNHQRSGTLVLLMLGLSNCLLHVGGVPDLTHW